MSPTPTTADAHRKNPSGGPSGSSGSSSTSTSTPTSDGGTTPDVGTPSSGGGGGLLSGLSLPTGRTRLLLIGGAALGVAYLYFRFRGGDDSGGGKRTPDDDDGGDDGGEGEIEGYPNITRDPDDPLAADEQALAILRGEEPEQATEPTDEGDDGDD